MDADWYADGPMSTEDRGDPLARAARCVPLKRESEVE
jgi:hypothetical protein